MHGIRWFLPEARFIFSSPSPPHPPSPSPSKTPWAGQRSPARVSANQNRRCDGSEDGGFAISALRWGTMGSEECEGDSSAQVGHQDTVLLKGNESQTQCTAYAGFSPRLVLFFRPRRHPTRRPLLPQKPLGLANVHPRECRQIRIVAAMEAKTGALRFRPCGGERWEARNAKATAPRRSATKTRCC